MNKNEIIIGQELYYNTTGANNSKISLLCKVIDIGQTYIWILIYGNLGFNNVLNWDLSIKPKYKVTNRNLKPEVVE